MPATRHLLPPSLFLAALLLAACPTLPEQPSCGVIPPGGCPDGRGGSCTDVSCEIIYACVSGRWVSSRVCAHPDAGASADGGGGGPPGDAGPCTPVKVTVQPQGTGCTPDLQQPDCPLEAAGACEQSACLSGCIDFYVCGANHGWTVAAYCDDNGTFISM